MNECTCVRAFMYLVLDDSGIGLCFFHAFFFIRMSTRLCRCYDRSGYGGIHHRNPDSVVYSRLVVSASSPIID